MNLATKVLIEQVQLIEEHQSAARAVKSGVKFNFDPGARQLSAERGEMIYEGIAETLYLCEPMAVHSHVTDLLSRSAPSIPDWPLTPSDLFIKYGFVSLQTPLEVESFLVSRFCWTQALDDRGVILTFWNEHDRNIYPLHWDFGKTARDLSERAGVVSKNQSAGVLKLWQTFLRFIRQTLTQDQKELPERIAVRQAERINLKPREVRIITLRRVDKVKTESTDVAQIDWSYRWWVSAHWRQQPCGPGFTERRPVLILPYLKGPEDKPILPKPQRIFDVVR